MLLNVIYTLPTIDRVINLCFIIQSHVFRIATQCHSQVVAADRFKTETAFISQKSTEKEVSLWELIRCHCMKGYKKNRNKKDLTASPHPLLISLVRQRHVALKTHFVLSDSNGQEFVRIKSSKQFHVFPKGATASCEHAFYFLHI